MLCESIGLHNTYALATLFIMTYYCNNTVTRNILRSVLEGTIMTLVGERRQREREREKVIEVTITKRTRYTDGLAIVWAYDRKVKVIVEPKGSEDDDVRTIETYVNVDVLSNIAGLFTAHAATA